MLKNHFLLVWRNLVKDRQFALLNLLGLASGLACALMIWLWVQDEMQIDKVHEKDSQLYQVMQNVPHDQGIETAEYTQGPLANALASEIPEIQYAATVIPASWFSSRGIVTAGEVRLKAREQFVSKDYFNMFSCRFIEGDKNKLAADKHFIAISDELAMKLFHSTTHIAGKTIEWDQGDFNGSYTIAGVFEKNSALVSDKFDILFNFDLFVEKRTGMLSWDNNDPRTYLLLKEGTNIARFNDKIKDFIKTKDAKSGHSLFVRRYSDRYLYGQYTNGIQSGGRIAYVKLFGAIAIFILLIACINFMNLSTARASRRIKEVGIKKVVGASRTNLILQYLGESVMMSFLSLLLGLGLIRLLLPAFNELTGKELVLAFHVNIVLTFIGIALLTGLIAGCYPALYISGFRPVAVLKGKLKTSVGELWVRKGMVTFQFALSVMAIAGVLVITRQIGLIQSKDLGYSRDNIIDFSIPMGDPDSASMSRVSSFINELKNIPGVVNVASYYHNLTGDHGSIGGFQWPGKDPGNKIDFANLEVGYGFLETMGIQIVAGHNFSTNGNAANEIIFNENAIRKMGLKDPIGKTVRFWNRDRVIVGIAKDFNFESLYESVKPCFFQMYPAMPNVIVKIKAGSEKQTIARVQDIYTRFNKGLSFDYRFLDEAYQALYVAENRVATLSKYFAGLAILISCLGLFGLAAFTAQRRQKEIGIRKVVGASASGIVLMLSKDYVKLIGVAALIGLPLIGWAMEQWLQDFAFRIRISADIFLIAALSVLVITLLTIGFQSVKAALVNPVKSLRAE
ncbi:ABC transporter permease [Paraflavitalea soli]|uniref:ABC transporter permease n=1 Tax=Paraflavitalea soli TaxID=2315862 RepID=A0A3B7MIS7_9BACT|nr:ABC transporter permease [Paraflavitalea soli]AXY73060.1 ABC transporter permease [Paraflavitalea soli]